MRRLVPWLVCVALAGCASGPMDADAVLSITDGAIVPGFEQASSDASALLTSVETLCADPGEAALQGARDAWQSAESSWEAAETATMFGPGNMMRTVAKVDYEPTDTEGIDEWLASETIIDAEYVDKRAPATRRGLGSVEYLLFGGLDFEPDSRVCDLAVAVSSVIAAETSSLLAAWTDSYDGAGPYRDTFVEEMATDSAMADVILAIVDTLKRQSGFELGRALGVTAIDPQPEAIPDGPAGAGAERYHSQLEGIRSQLTAGGENSLLALLTARSEEVANRVESLLDDALSDLSTIDQPLADLVVDDPDRLKPLQATLADLVTVFESDVVSALDITLGFSDTDGDSG